ncbi:uncharacterized protein LOC143179550 [Calliopsis andreniformis]|uniref:uncharacterized protein LOC143179550 n=1 Tax=Calliopsis andreniformis TaxID=337506 RepID=UPI003FCCDDA0
MALKVKEHLLLIATTILIGVSSVFAWNHDIHRYESYDLDRGPVFYEAYYPDTNEEARSNYQEKRFFDRGAVLEKTYQVPSQRLTFSEDAIRRNSYQNRAENLLQNVQNDRLPPQANTQPLDIKEISNLARRAISKDLENWNALENYLDRTNYQDSLYQRQMVVPEPGYRVGQSIRGFGPSLPDPSKEGRDLSRQMYEQVLVEPSDLTDQRPPDAIRRLTARDLANRDSLRALGSIPYQDHLTNDQEVVRVREASVPNVPLLKGTDQSNIGSVVEPYLPEDIFAPRPQVINYIFSRKPSTTVQNKAQSVSEVKEKEPRNYGDNLIREEMKKEESKDVKVTSIEVSEVPKHKTRHHHGEWPKRDYSKHH